MMRVWGTVLAVLALTVSGLGVVTPGITLIGKGVADGNARDKSGFKGDICQAGVPTNCVSKAIFGGFGSDLAYTGFKDVFIAAPDRGPFDGLTDVPYLDRFHFSESLPTWAPHSKHQYRSAGNTAAQEQIRRNVCRRGWGFWDERFQHAPA
jgi:hypothetical protein